MIFYASNRRMYDLREKVKQNVRFSLHLFQNYRRINAWNLISFSFRTRRLTKPSCIESMVKPLCRLLNLSDKPMRLLFFLCSLAFNTSSEVTTQGINCLSEKSSLSEMPPRPCIQILIIEENFCEPISLIVTKKHTNGNYT